MYYSSLNKHESNELNFVYSIRVIMCQHCSLTKLMVSHDLPRSTVTNQITFDQQDFHSTPEFERAIDRRCQALVSKLETLDTITFT